MPGRNVKSEWGMTKRQIDWTVTCDREAFKRCQQEPKFPYIVALARAVNALNTSHSLIVKSYRVDTPEVIRNRMNSFFFSSALLYEGIRLVRKMKKLFADDDVYQQGLGALLRDPVAQRVEQMHLNPARNRAVFHFLPEEFERAIREENHPSCTFIGAHGTKNRHVHFSYADVVAAEMLVGIPSDKEEFWPAVRKSSEDTGALLMRFAESAERIIVRYLMMWGFRQ
jgi:hypothetical protein